MLAIPTYWVRQPRAIPGGPGMHRVTWDLHYTPLKDTGPRAYPMQAVQHDTPPTITSLWAAPGQYTVRLTAGGQTYRQPLVVRMDPRLKTPITGVQQQFTLSKQLYDDALRNQKALDQLRALRAQIKQVAEKAGQSPAAEAIAAFDKKAAALDGGGGPGGRGVPAGPLTLTSANTALGGLMRQLEAADVTSSTQVLAAITERRAAFLKVMTQWNALKGSDLAALNAQLKRASLPEIGM
jgi:hypothetical protein